MIGFGQWQIAADDPLLLGAAVVGLLLLFTLLAAWRAGRAAARAADHTAWLSQRMAGLSEGQERLAGGLTQATAAQAQAQTAMLALMETRLAEVARGMGDSLHGSASRTARALGEVQERLQVIDRAQARIEALSGNVLSLQDILSNKQARGAFGEIQLNDIVTRALPPDAYSFQVTMGNGRRADCLIRLPDPPGPIVIDAKFPLEAYEALRRAKGEVQLAEAARAFRAAVRTHLRAIAERYIVEGETADGAMMFLPSEAVYAELHANFGDVVREGFGLKVWTVSPTTCMATLNTLRAVLKDARMREQAQAIRVALRQLHRDVDLVVERAGRLETHFAQARADLDGLSTAAERAGKRAARLDAMEFDTGTTAEAAE
ncbi:MAG: DNA recombination protein RmuC [Paracoccaceae bacterium]|nr:MAG: DNA recombination protein RmuC [Paracoccaceae bacterium]